MFDTATVQAGFLSLIGWRNTPNTEYPRLNEQITESASGLYYNDAHPLLTVENIEAIAPDFDSMNAITWDEDLDCKAGSLYRHEGIVYICLVDNKDNEPTGVDDDYFATALSNYIADLTRTSIVKLLQRWLVTRKIAGTNRSLLDNWKLFDGEGRSRSSVIGEGRFVGFEIKTRSFNAIQVVINQVGLQLTDAVTDLLIYVYHSSVPDALTTVKFTSAKPYGFVWKSFEALLDFCKYSKNDTTGAFYVGYYEDDLTAVMAVNRELDFFTPPCGGCFKDTYNRLSYERVNRFVRITPFLIPAGGLKEGRTLFDLSDIAYETSNNFGLNLALSTRCDYTDFLLEQKELFTGALMKQVAYDIIYAMAFQVRKDPAAEALRAEAYIEVKGGEMKGYKHALEYQLDQEIQALNIDTSGFDSPCFQKFPNKGLRLGAIT